MMSRTEYMLTELWTTRPNNIESTQPHTLTSTPATQNTVMVKKINGNFFTQKNRDIKKSNTASYLNQRQQKQQKLFKK